MDEMKTPPPWPDLSHCAYTTPSDSGPPPALPATIGSLLAAALDEVAFCWEAGPLSTWSN
jgi:hypothetical protein